MIVFLAGMQRSGSTFSFNVVRHLLERRGKICQVPSSDLIGVLEQSTGADHLLMKSHSANDQVIRLARLGAVKVICTVRKPEDAIASGVEVFGFSLEDAIDHMRTWLDMFCQLRTHALVIPYRQIDTRPWRATWDIARHVCPDARPYEIIKLASKYRKSKVKAFADELRNEDENISDMGFSYFDNTTFFHRRHVSTLKSRSAVDRIGDDAVKSIRAALREHLDPSGELILQPSVTV